MVDESQKLTISLSEMFGSASPLTQTSTWLGQFTVFTRAKTMRRGSERHHVDVEYLKSAYPLEQTLMGLPVKSECVF